MSKNPNSAKKESASTSAKERIIPIKIETDEPKKQNAPISTRLQTKKKDTKQIQPTFISKEELETTFLSEDTSPVSLFNLSQQSDSAADSDGFPERPIPPIFVPEKIIIILDRSLDDNFTHFEQKSGKKYNPLYMLQNAIQIFVLNKHAMSTDHEFALMVLNDNSVSWIHDFTNSPQDIITSLASIKPCKPEDIFSMNTVFDVICKHVTLPNIMGVATPFVVRAILLYDRSYSIPFLEKTAEIDSLLHSPLFTFDVIMTHEPPSTANHCDSIFEKLQKIDKKGFSYSFSVSRNSKDLHIAMGKVLAHSLQRPPQSLLNYDITQFKL